MAGTFRVTFENSHKQRDHRDIKADSASQARQKANGSLPSGSKIISVVEL